MAHYPTNAPVLAATPASFVAAPRHSNLRAALAVGLAEAGVLLVRGSAAALLMSPLVVAAVFLAR